MNDLINTNTPAKQQKLGKRYIPATACSYPPEVNADDVLLVNFDADSVTVDGLYLVERYQDGAVTWMGCRRFEIRLADGGLNLYEANGDVVPFDGSLTIAGRVLRVYRPVA